MTDSLKPPRRTNWVAEIRSLAALLLLVVGIHSLIARPFYIPSESMMPGLQVGDRLVVSKYPYGWSYASPSFHFLPFIEGRLFGRMPERGDIVIVSRPEPGKSEDLIKRVVGLPGDSVQMVRGRLWLNGKPVPTVDLGYRRLRADSNLRCSAYDPEARPQGDRGEPYCRLHVLRETLPGGRSYDVLDLYPSRQDDTAPYRVPAGHVFLLGDNRDNSADSRFPLTSDGLGGAVPVEAIGGRAEFVTFSLKGEATWNPMTWFPDFRTDRSGVSLRPRK
ncbi:MAG TPA: signal peptidase I [Allosphingosinicella sp.]|nr:signal peptidase I [Allosphingosinicella sp.]